MRLLYLQKRALALMATIVLGLMVAGCGGGGGDASPPPPPPTSGTITGYVTVPGTSAAAPPVGAAALAASAKAQNAPPDQAGGTITKGGTLMATGGAAPNPTDGAIEYHVHFRWASGVSAGRKAEIINAEGLTQGGAAFGAMQSYRTNSNGSVLTIQRRLSTYTEMQDVNVLVPPKPQFVPTDNYYVYQWDMKQMGLERAWDITRGSASVRVAVIDTGIQMNHAEFSGGRLVDGYDFVSDPVNAGDGNGRDSNPTDEADTSKPGVESHGTHVAGTIGANAGNGGTVGVDHFCQIMPVRALGLSGGSMQDIFDAMIYAADLQNADLGGFSWYASVFPTGLDPARPRPSQAANVINMSIGGTLDRTAAANIITIYNDILQAVNTKGITVVVAAGNDNDLISTASYVKMPAGSPSVICVGSTAPNLTRAAYSNFGSEITVCAPGGDMSESAAVVSGFPESGGILSTNKDTATGTFCWLQGTSMASPHVAGVCALMKAINPGLSPVQIKTILQNTAYDLGTAGFDSQYGYGFVMADRAVYAAAGTTPAIQLVAYTGGLNYEPSVTSSSFVMKNNGGSYAALGTMTYSLAYGPGASGWISGLTSTPGGTDSATIGVNINRASIADGTYTATLTMNSTNGGNLNIPVTMKVLALPPAPPFTDVFVLLIDATTDAVVAQKVLTLPGRSFTFTGVAPGTYYVCAGTDLNNNGQIDDAGEYFGVYEVTVESIEFSIIAGQNKTGVAIPLTLVVNPSG